MRCLNCYQDNLPLSTVTCPKCRVHLPSLMRDILSSGTILDNKYHVDYALGRGGFGITYRAMHLKTEQLVAIKEFYPHEYAIRDSSTGSLTILSSSKDAYRRGLQRFLREAKTLARLNHPNIVRVQDFFEQGKTAYLVMELISGISLRERLEQKPSKSLPSETIEQIVTPIVSALATAHAASIYHLDLKPDNILIAPDGRVVLIDFGASKQGMSTKTTRAFTLDYAPLEVVSAKEIGPESDLYELGVMIYEMLSGKKPPNALERIADNSWQPIKLNQPWQNLIQEALFLEKDKRPDSVKTWWESAFAEVALPESISKKRGEFSILKQLNSIYIIADRLLVKSRQTGEKIALTRRNMLNFAAFTGVGLSLAVLGRYILTTDRGAFNIYKNEFPIPPSENSLATLNFETITINEKGKTIRRTPKQANYFSENLGNNIVLESIAIPGGNYMIGAALEEKGSVPDETPQHRVRISPFYLGKYPITQAQWQEIARLPQIDRYLNPNPSFFVGKDLPVETISWQDAVEFCQRLSQKTGRKYTLPTEAEWEYACRAGTKTPFHLGPTITGNLANYNDLVSYASEPLGKHRAKTTRVGSFPPNSFGLYDMHGLVFEWCQDVWHPNYQQAPTDGSARRVTDGEEEGIEYRVLRGGSWSSKPIFCRSANRAKALATDRYVNFGFRVVLRV